MLAWGRAALTPSPLAYLAFRLLEFHYPLTGHGDESRLSLLAYRGPMLETEAPARMWRRGFFPGTSLVAGLFVAYVISRNCAPIVNKSLRRRDENVPIPLPYYRLSSSGLLP